MAAMFDQEHKTPAPHGILGTAEGPPIAAAPPGGLETPMSSSASLSEIVQLARAALYRRRLGLTLGGG
jgi:hypothetical protein